MSCGPGRDSAERSESAAGVRRAASCSALTASCTGLPPSGAGQRQGQGQGGQLSELTLEFRLSTPDAAAFVGSVGPPPITAEDSAAPAMARDGGGGGGGGKGHGGRAEEGLEDEPRGREEEETDSVGGPWGVSRQSVWVQARSRPSVYLALISCASTDPEVPGFVFWCVASRQASRPDDCAACVSGAAGHGGHPGQMRIDLHPVALVWNHCSQPMRAALNYTTGSGGWSGQRADSAEFRATEGAEASDEDAGGRVADCKRNPAPSYSLSRSTAAILPGGRTAVCQQPFVDYELAVTSTAAKARGPDGQAHPFLVSVPSELLSCRCKSTWLPLHSRALTENVLCPLVVVASRLLDADWPALSLNVYPGLSVQNHLSVPLSLRAAFARPVLGGDGEPCVQPKEDEKTAPAGGGAESAQLDQEEQAAQPLLRRESSGGGESTSGSGERGGSNGAVARVDRLFRVPAQSCHSAWDMFHSDGLPIPFLLPDVSLELATSPAGAWPSLATSIGDAEEALENLPPRHFSTNCSRKLKLSLEDDLDEVVLVPWETGNDGAVLPVYVTLEREAVLGGVELIRLAVHPRVVVHNATGLPLSLSLLGASQADRNHKPEVGAQNETLPPCRVCLAPEGNGSCVNLLVVPGKRVQLGPNGSYQEPPRTPAAASSSSAAAGGGGAGGGSGRAGEPESSPSLDTDPPSGILGKLSRMLTSGSYKSAAQNPAGFSADVEVAFGRDGSGASIEDGGEGTPGGSLEPGEEAAGTAPTGGVDELAVFSIHEPSAGSALVCKPSSLTVRSSRARAVRVCVATEGKGSPGTEPTPTPPTRHVLLYQDPQPDVTICNRSAGSVTLLFDCGALVEVGPGGTAEHSWQQGSAVKDRSYSGGGGGGGGSSSARRRTSSVSATDQHRRQWSVSSRGSDNKPSSPTPNTPTPRSSAPGSPSVKNGPGAPVDARRSCVSSPAPRKARVPGKLGGEATLQHWFQCKGGSKDDVFLSWSDPVWVARGVQVMRFHSRNGGGGDEEGWGYRDAAQGGGGDDEVGGDSGSGGPQDGFGAGSARQVQVHVVERAGGFVMSFAEGGFDGAAADGVVDANNGAGENAHESR